MNNSIHNLAVGHISDGAVVVKVDIQSREFKVLVLDIIFALYSFSTCCIPVRVVVHRLHIIGIQYTVGLRKVFLRKRLF